MEVGLLSINRSDDDVFVSNGNNTTVTSCLEFTGSLPSKPLLYNRGGHTITPTASMATIYPFMDINLHASDSSYAFTSPSNPNAPTLVIDRPSGDLRLNDAKPSGAKRVMSIAGILGIIKLRLGD